MSNPTIILTDVYTEGATGQGIDVDLGDPANNNAAIDTASIVSIHGTLRSLDTGEALFVNEDLLDSERATYPGGAGVVRVTFTAADMAAKGSRALQKRLLTLQVVHSVDQVWQGAVQFPLANLEDAPLESS